MKKAKAQGGEDSKTPTKAESIKENELSSTLGALPSSTRPKRTRLAGARHAVGKLRAPQTKGEEKKV
jgi:hypothetical protein